MKKWLIFVRLVIYQPIIRYWPRKVSVTVEELEQESWNIPVHFADILIKTILWWSKKETERKWVIFATHVCHGLVLFVVWHSDYLFGTWLWHVDRSRGWNTWTWNKNGQFDIKYQQDKWSHCMWLFRYIASPSNTWEHEKFRTESSQWSQWNTYSCANHLYPYQYTLYKDILSKR